MTRKRIILPFLIGLSYCLIQVQTVFSQQAQAINHVIVIGFDGFGAYSVEKANMPYLKTLMQKGAYTLKTRSVLPSSSAVNWASMFMGASPTFHGYTEWGSQTPEIPSVTTNKEGLFPSLFTELKSQKPSSKIAAVYSWEGIGHLLEDRVLNQNIHTDGKEEETLNQAIRLIENERPNLLFVHFDEPDGVGHDKGHDTQEYYEELKNVDKKIKAIHQAVVKTGLEENTLFVVVADHGGIDKGHGGKTLSEVEVPWVMAGPSVSQGKVVQSPTIIYDIGPTLARALGIEGNPVWRGKIIQEFFRD